LVILLGAYLIIKNSFHGTGNGGDKGKMA
jgi:hypothetical protein